MFSLNTQGNLQKRSFDDLEKEKLGNYVYALRDPRDGKIFYIGQGVNNRLFDHFQEADDCLKNQKVASSKVIRILDIWKNEENVDWFLVAHGLKENADYVESAVIDVLSQSQNGICLNEINGPKSSMLTQDDIKITGAQPINPNQPIGTVFVFPITNGLADGKTPYNATRSAWYVKKEFRSLSPAFAVGIKNRISVGSYSVKEWTRIANKYEFNEGESEELLSNKNWGTVLTRVMGYWQRGNYIIVKFDGCGKCKIIRGAGQDSVWFDL